MTQLRFISWAILFTVTSGVFAGTTQVKYEGQYSIEKSSQVKHLNITQTDPKESKIKNA